MILLSFFNSIFVNMFRPALWTLYHFFIFDNLTPLSKNHTLIQQRPIPLVANPEEYSQAIALSSTTYQLLGVLGPGLAGSIAAFVGTRQVFFLDGITFLIASILIMTLPKRLIVNRNEQKAKTIGKTLQDIKIGTMSLFHDCDLRYALAMQLVAALSGAAILVNTVGYVQGTLALSKIEYGWVMASFGIGATLASVGLGNFNQKYKQTLLTSIGAIIITIAMLPVNWGNLNILLLLWLIAGIGQPLVNVPTQTLIANKIAIEFQGRVYGAHFAWSHLWWAFSYPLAGWMGSNLSNSYFFYSGIIGVVFLILIHLIFK